MTRVLSPNTPIAQVGSVLIVVLWASVGLVSIALLFGHSMMMNYRGADNDLAGRQADQAIEGAIRYAETLLTEQETKGTLPDLTTYQGEAMQVGEAEFWLLGRADGDVNGNTREYGLVDEASKLNVNTTPPAILAQLPGMTDDLAATIVEWRTQSAGGVPSDDVKGALCESVDELALVAGMTREILYGEDANQNGIRDNNEDDGELSLPQDNSDGKLDPGIAEYLTVFTKEPATQPDGTTPRIVVSTLTSQAVVSALMTVIDTAVPGHATFTIQPLPYPSVVEFIATSGVSPALSEEDIDKIVPYLVSPDLANAGQPLLKGLVNVNTASETVLRVLVGDSVATDLVDARLSRGTPSTGLAWAVTILQGAATPASLPFLTGQSYQVTADIAAVGRHGRGYRRARVVIDMSDATKGPQVVYRRNLAPLGWALGREIRENLALKKEVR